MGARISKRGGSYNFKKEEDKQLRLVSKNLRKTLSVVSLSEATIYGDYAVVAALSREHSLIGELRKRQEESRDKAIPVASKKFDSASKTVTWKDSRDETRETSNDPGRTKLDAQNPVVDEEQTEVKNFEQVPIQEDDESLLISDIKMVSTEVINNLTDIQKQLIPICKEYLEVKTNQSKGEITPKINGECNNLSNRDEQIEVPQVNSNCNGDSIIDLNLISNNSLEKGKLSASSGIYTHRRTKTISGNSDLSYKLIDNSDVDLDSIVSDTFYDANDYESDGQLEVWEAKRRQDKLIIEEVTTEIVECVNEQTKSNDLENINSAESRSSSINDAQIEVPDEIQPADEIIESKREEGSISSLESQESLENFEKRGNFETISNFSDESKYSIIDVENSEYETKESVKVEKVDADTLHEIDINFLITEKLPQVENENNEIEIENYLPIEKVLENQLDESTAETASGSNEITEVMQENNENLNLQQTIAENTNKLIGESFSNGTFRESSTIISSSDNLLNYSKVENEPSSVVADVNFENFCEGELPLDNNIDEEVEIIISQINTVVDEINYLKEKIDNLTSEMQEEHSISEMYQNVIKLMRNVNAIKYSKFNEKVINLQHIALNKIHYCLKKLQSVEVTKEQV